MSPQLEQYKAFAFYNRDFNQRLFELANSLSDDDRKQDRGAFFGSIHATFDHILLADRAWLTRFRDANIAADALVNTQLLENLRGPGQLLFDDWQGLQLARQETDNAITNWTNALTTTDIEQTMHYQNSKGETRDHPAWLAITHLFNHQTHHRGQITTLLSQLGLDPGLTDYLIIVNRGFRGRTLPEG